jgi:hypothetical protein
VLVMIRYSPSRYWANLHVFSGQSDSLVANGGMP